VLSLLAPILVGVFVLGAVVVASDAYIVPSDSMRPTLVPGDVLLCISGLTIDPGDLVVFEAVGGANPGVKRVVALPSDTVSYVNKVLEINGEAAPKALIGKLPLDDAMDLIFEQKISGVAFHVIEAYGHSLVDIEKRVATGYFLLGDNRDVSMDSRHFGDIPGSSIHCKVTAIVATEGFRGFRFDRLRFF
jgi:signal peptidase I